MRISVNCESVLEAYKVCDWFRTQGFRKTNKIAAYSFSFCNDIITMDIDDINEKDLTFIRLKWGYPDPKRFAELKEKWGEVAA